MVNYLFTYELELTLKADQAPIRRDAVATLARIMRQAGPPSDRALATLWLFHLANHDPDERVRAMAAVPIRLTAVWSEGLEDKLYAPDYETRLDAVFTLASVIAEGPSYDAQQAYQWLAWLAGNDPHAQVSQSAMDVLGWQQEPSVSEWQPRVIRSSPWTGWKKLEGCRRLIIVGVIFALIALAVALTKGAILSLFALPLGFGLLGSVLFQMSDGEIPTKFGKTRGLGLLILGPIQLALAIFFIAIGLTAILPIQVWPERLFFHAWLTVTLLGYSLSAPHTFIPFYRQSIAVLRRLLYLILQGLTFIILRIPASRMSHTESTDRRR